MVMYKWRAYNPILLSFQLGVYKKECKRLQEKDELRLRAIKRHPSVDRSKSYPVTSSLSYEEDTVDPISSIALPPSMCGKREGYLSLRDFRHEQLKRVSIETVWWLSCQARRPLYGTLKIEFPAVSLHGFVSKNRVGNKQHSPLG